MRIALGVEYDGTLFYGWQTQQGLRTVQEELEKAIGQVANHPIEVCCGGRTDKGVHAFGQVVHFDTHAERAERNWLLGINQYLPRDIAVKWIETVPDTFHARFSAIARKYRYIIYNYATRPAINRFYQTWHVKHLDADKMHQAAQLLIGEHDFSSFRDADCQANSPVRHLQEISVTRLGHEVIIDITANAFLHHMVRNIVGTLFLVGEGKKEPGWVGEVLLAKDRRAAGITAAPEGLCLVGITYSGKPDHFQSKGY